MTVSLSRRIVRSLLACSRGSFDADIAAKTRLHIADSIGISIASRSTGVLHEHVLAYLSTCGSGPCMVYGRPERLPATGAAFCNAAMGHVVDFDDIHDIARVHVTTVTLPAALAAADLCGAGAGAVHRAVAAGNELMVRMGLMLRPTGTGPSSNWFLSQLFGYFGAALAAGMVLGLDEDEQVSALGMAYMQGAGGKETAFGTGANARAIYPAFAAMGGVQAALMSRAGIRGPETVFEGAANLFRLYLGGDASPAQLETLTAQDRWVFLETDIKPWPSCRISHPYIAAALAVRADLGPGTVERVVAAVNDSAAKLCNPLAERRVPRTLQDAKYSVPFMVAFALVHGEVNLSTLTDAALADADVLALAARVEIEHTLPDVPGHPPAEVRVHTQGGVRVGRFGGDLTVQPAQIEEKFHDCFRAAGLAVHSQPVWAALQNPAMSIADALGGINH